jgi:hypothetical protein
MCQSVQDQLRAFVAYIKSDPVGRRALQQKQWTDFARWYNGPEYWKKHYDKGLEHNYEQATP